MDFGKRSPHWPGVDRAFLRANPLCRVCGRPKAVQAHHRYPYHYVVGVGRPDLELDPRNLMSLCADSKEDHHILIGHLGCYESYNPNLEHWVTRSQGRSSSHIKVLGGFHAALASRPKFMALMNLQEKTTLRAQLDEAFPADPVVLAEFKIVLDPFTPKAVK